MIRTVRDGILALGTLCGAVGCLTIFETVAWLLEEADMLPTGVTAAGIAAIAVLWWWLIGTMLYAHLRVRRWWMWLTAMVNLVVGAGLLTGGLSARLTVPGYAGWVFVVWSLVWWIQRHRLDPERWRAKHGL